MSRVVSFSVDNQFADELDNLVQTSGYDNRSRFLRDASLHFAEELQRGSIGSMDEDVEIEGILVVFFQHGRHTPRQGEKKAVSALRSECE